MQVIRVRYWAAARSAAGMDEEDISVPGPITLTELHAELGRRHTGARFWDVIEACAVMIGDRPVSSHDPDAVVVRPGDSVEFLPPFAGG